MRSTTSSRMLWSASAIACAILCPKSRNTMRSRLEQFVTACPSIFKSAHRTSELCYFVDAALLLPQQAMAIDTECERYSKRIRGRVHRTRETMADRELPWIPAHLLQLSDRVRSPR